MPQVSHTTPADPVVRSLVKSEADYFRAGSKNTQLLGGTLSIAEGFESLAAGCVMHDVDGEPSFLSPGKSAQEIDRLISRWLESLEDVFARKNAKFCRFYLPWWSAFEHDTVIRSRRFSRVIEVGLCRTLTNLNDFGRNLVGAPKGVLMELKSKDDWQTKKQLYQSARLGPDGHDMLGGLFADFEQLKCDRGYMTSYLFWHEGRCKGAVSLAINGAFGRLKNLFIHPDFRNRGLGRQVVALVIDKAREAGMHSLGVYALENQDSHELYRFMGLTEVVRQVEWCKSLST